MIKHQYEQGILIVHIFACRASSDYLFEQLQQWMEDDRCAAHMALVNFHHQFDWRDYLDFIAEGEYFLLQIHSIGIIVQDYNKLTEVEFRGGLLRALGIDVKVVTEIKDMIDWACAKLPERYFFEIQN